jgi:hypothetical protein
MRVRRWPTLNEMRDTYAASGLELAKRHPACRGKIRYAQAIDADRHRVELMGSPDEHARAHDAWTCTPVAGVGITSGIDRRRRDDGQARRIRH